MYSIGRNSSQYEPVHSTGLLSQSEKQGGKSEEENVKSNHPEMLLTHDSPMIYTLLMQIMSSSVLIS